jgi:hypothetical protein
MSISTAAWGLKKFEPRQTYIPQNAQPEAQPVVALVRPGEEARRQKELLEGRGIRPHLLRD